MKYNQKKTHMDSTKENLVLTDEMQRAMHLIKHDRKPLFITGKAGTGKTTFLRHIAETMGTHMAITAPTGVAAINAGGTTLHSMFQIPFGVASPDHPKVHRLPASKSAVLKALSLLVIDEVSMVRPDILDFVDFRLRTERGCREPFGGVQVVMFGDLFQLPPVVKPEEQEALGRFYAGEYFFYSRAILKAGMNVVELNKVFRQREADFIDILNRVRDYSVTDEDLFDLCTLRDVEKSKDYDSRAIHLCTHKKTAQKINDKMLGQGTFTWAAEYVDDFSKGSAPCDDTLRLNKGARVMVLVNDHQQGYVNGSLGEVKEFGGTIEKPSVRVLLDNGKMVDVSVNTWEAVEYAVDEEGNVERKVKGKCRQIPLTLAWAITIHKSQGLTFDNVVLHLQRSFCPGQVYVALSRCRTIDGVVTDGFISKKHIIPDMRLVAFMKAYRENCCHFDGDVMREMREILKEL